LVKEMAKTLGTRVRYCPQEKLFSEVLEIARPLDTIMTLGAGELHLLHQELKEHLRVPKGAGLIKKYRLGVVSGGQSPEHEVSLRSREVSLLHVDQEVCEIVSLTIGTDGRWCDADGLSLASGEGIDRLKECDVVWPLLHGPNGEDGLIPAALQVAGIPYIGCGRESCAIAMNKALTKQLLEHHEVPVVPFLHLRRNMSAKEIAAYLDRAVEKWGFPLFAKGVHLGSTLGVYRVADRSELVAAVEAIWSLDDQMVIEPLIEGRELEFAVYGNDEPICFPPGEIMSAGRVHTYEGKYGTALTPYRVMADMETDLLEAGWALAERVYRLLGCCGCARIDTFLTTDRGFLINEVNPMPGMTSTSLYPMMCEANGLSREAWIEYQLSSALFRTQREICGQR
ncbi:MAG: D-alanine--D-alanine ligase, partial [Chlamydiia bacterium]|nr:D-alanine--D-alanine ligase [Chlamydiia bacterium]